MKIKYFTNGETIIARGFSNTFGPEGVPEEVVFSALTSDKLDSKDHSILMSNSDFTSTASPHKDDSYNYQVGHDIARDKTIIKNCLREQKQLEVIHRYLECELNNIEKRMDICLKKKYNAEMRLVSFK